MIDMTYLTKALVKFNASDLHLKVGRPPLFRINGKIIPAKMENMTQEIIESLVRGILSSKLASDLELKRNVDLSFQIKELGRFRCNVYYQRGTISVAIRMISNSIPNLDSLGVPSVIKELCQRPRGLILITGATGSGKSTTLAATIQYLNENRQVHILNIEDPIEFTYHDQKATVTQREIGTDAVSMSDALIASLRQDPDIIVLGEIRDAAAIQTALTAAETGHLVFSTLHTTDAKSSIERILDVFRPEAQAQIRMQLATTLVAVFCQQLVPRADGNGSVLASEVLVKSPAVENYIRHNELERISEAMDTSNTYYKMQTLNQALEKLILAGTITLEEGLKASGKPDNLKLRLSGVDKEGSFVTR